MLRGTFKYRLYPNRRQREKLQATLDVCRELYNAALQARREAWSSHRDFQHKLSRHLVNNYRMIFVEDLNVKGLSRARPAKSVHDTGWAAFFQKLSYKAEIAGRSFLPVDARGTSQRCPRGEPNLKRLSNREHVCVKCGLVTTRDHASAMEILRVGLSLQSLTAVQQCCR